ncbi:unnamed protein product [Oikopleura dioica]|uniref:ribonuclease H n=1 Tax=Oikopleura dioica TaxID=34765 RepID=E4Y4E7_OIKDI|nr:unnamed protein product [Oikopleura dioica]
MADNPLTIKNERLRISKVVPKPYEVIKGRLKALTVPNQDAVRERSEEILQQLKEWCRMGSVTLRKDDKKPWITAGFILVDRPEKDTRICLNGSILKPLELYTFPCKMDSVKTAIQMLQKGDVMAKFDDKKGYHQMPLAAESKKMACFKWGNYIFENNILAFGIPAAPGMYQLLNSVGINFLRQNGIKITLYLDDRLLIISPKSENHRKKLLTEEILCKEVWLVAATLVALGGFVNIKKSEFKPTQRIEFLGFILDTNKETVEIPEGRWNTLKKRMRDAESGKMVELKLLERIRGTQASMVEVFSNMRMLIRQITILIMQTELEKKTETVLTKEVRREWKLWYEFEKTGLSRSWKREDRSDAGLLIYTDASKHAGAIVIEKWKLSEKFAWEEDLAAAHIGIKEAAAIRMALEWYGRNLAKKRVTFLCDNDSVVQGAINGSKDPEMNKQLVRIWMLAQKRKIDLKIEWVSTKLQKADDPSRIIDTREQKLTVEGFAYLQSHLQKPFEIDVAATEINKKCAIFIARKMSQNAFGADFLTFPIHKLLGKTLYAFPPRKIALAYYKRLLQIAAPWALIVTSYEAENPVLTLAREKGFRLISLPNDCIWTPTKGLSQHGFWKIADNIAEVHAIVNRL